MHLSLKAKQIGGISLIVALAILALSYTYLTKLVRQEPQRKQRAR